MAEQKIAADVAEAEFQKLCDLRRLDIDPDGMNAEEVESFGKLKSVILKALRAGSLIVNDDGSCVYTPPVPSAKSLTFYRATGASFMAMDTVAKGKEMGKMVAVITDMTRSNPGDVSKLEAPDFAFCSKLVNLFLAQG